MAYTDIDKSDDYFNTVTYTGNGGTNNITGVNFQPDFVWIKKRDSVVNHRVYDVVRGVDTNYYKLFPNLSNAENAIQTNELTSLDSDGFTLESSTNVNSNGGSYVSWNWLAGGTGVSNTQGSITSTVSASTTSGFSVVTWTGNGTNGASIGHGLGTTPSSWIIKQRTGTQAWLVYHPGLSATDNYLQLSAVNAEATNAPNIWSADSTTLTFPTSYQGTNGSGSDYVGYFFAEKKGFSKFGSYTGNGSANGPFVYTGFKPAWFLLKRYDSGSSANWEIYDTTRDTYNQAVKRLAPSLSDAEATNFALGDILSNGVKIRQTDQTWNASGGTYIYMAFAESPFTTSTGIPTTAR